MRRLEQAMAPVLNRGPWPIRCLDGSIRKKVDASGDALWEKKRAAGWRAFSFWGERENYGEERKGEAFDRKSPPIAKGAKGGAPSRSFVGWRLGDPRAQARVPVPEVICDRMLGVLLWEKLGFVRGGTLWV